MPYDDNTEDDWRDYDSLAALIERIRGSQRMSITGLAELVNKVHRLGQGRGNSGVSVAEVSQALREAGLTNVPIGIVDEVLRVAAEVPLDADAADHITLAQARRIIGG
ncbi:hypothetical protein L612_002000000250 [Rhodococcus rhodochrous J38]|uniref:hypothetical protein n=1 Tax=Rhodococcus rhodochrous TaxID=1829 RepID=UPI00119FCC1E|nr:hypothetical protein [Rhodococcus rhodochrous]TWH52614.1 hypothetical protein L612_002000000250 [Rhodococcus rhodochrous J38]